MIQEDLCVYFKQFFAGFFILILYVDNILMAFNDRKLIYETKSWLLSYSDLKDTNMLRVKIQKRSAQADS